MRVIGPRDAYDTMDGLPSSVRFASVCHTALSLNRLTHPFWQQLASHLDEPIVDVSPLSHSTCGPTFKIKCRASQYFVKLCQVPKVLAAEYDGLGALSQKQCIRVPRPIALETIDSTSVLVSEYIELGHQKADFSRFAAELFALHSNSGTTYGWHCDN